MLKNMAGLKWSALFNVSEEEKKQILQRIKTVNPDNFGVALILPYDKFNYNDPDVLTAAERTVLKFCVSDTDFAKDILDTDEYVKAAELYARKQYNGKLLKSVLAKFSFFILSNSYYSQILYNLIAVSLKEAKTTVYNERVEKEFLPLKKSIDRITSGLKSECFLEAKQEIAYNAITFDLKSNDYLKNVFGYDYNEIHGHYESAVLPGLWDIKGTLAQILSFALYGDAEFWKTQKTFNIYNFVEAAREYNTPRHAEKLLSHIFLQIKTNPFGKLLIQNNLPLIYIDWSDFVKNLEERTYRFAFEIFEKKFGAAKIDLPLCYPLSEIKNAGEVFADGKRVFEEYFVRALYPDNSEKITEWLKVSVAGLPDQSNDVREIFEKFSLGYNYGKSDKAAITAVCPEYFSGENIWNRVFIKAYILNKYFPGDRCGANVFELFYGITQMIERETGIQTSYQKNTVIRENAFKRISDKLGEFGIIVSEKSKIDYIVSLLDRKVATWTEVERYQALEQLGDAVYGFAVAELLFYQPNASKDISKIHEDLIRASAQIKISELFGFDRLYLSASSMPCKYTHDSVHSEDMKAWSHFLNGEFSTEKKHLADSLEMIIGAVCENHGIESALSFAKTLLLKAFPDTLKAEIKRTRENILRKDIERDYWTRILPAPYSDFDKFLMFLWQAFDKLMLSLVLGTDTVKKRRFITNSFGSKAVYGEGDRFEVNAIFYDYLTKGLKFAVDTHGETILNNYNK